MGRIPNKNLSLDKIKSKDKFKSIIVKPCLSQEDLATRVLKESKRLLNKR